MPNTASRLNSQMYVVDDSPASTILFQGSPVDRNFHTITCLARPGGSFVNVVAPMVETITGSLANGAQRANSYRQYGDFGWDGKLSGKLIENDTKLFNTNLTGSFTASQSGGTVAASTVTVTRAGVDVTSSITPPAFDGITTDAAGTISAILPTSTVGADLQVGDVLTFDVLVSSSSIGGATLTLQAKDIGLNAGVYEIQLMANDGENWTSIDETMSPSVNIDIKVGQTVTGSFASITCINGAKVIGYK